MAHVLNVVYPNDPSAKFDIDYYLKSHMPLVGKHWSSLGLTEWKIIQFSDSSAPYRLQAILTWSDKASLDKALKEASAEVFGDVKNFTSVTPQTFSGEVIISS